MGRHERLLPTGEGPGRSWIATSCVVVSRLLNLGAWCALVSDREDLGVAAKVLAGLTEIAARAVQDKHRISNR